MSTERSAVPSPLRFDQAAGSTPIAPTARPPLAVRPRGSLSQVSLYHRGHWQTLNVRVVERLVLEMNASASASRAAALRSRAELGVVLLFMRHHVAAYRGGHGAWGPVLNQLGINYKTAERAIETAVLWADKSIVAKATDAQGKPTKLKPVCDSSVLAEGAFAAGLAGFTGVTASFDKERTAWHTSVVQRRAVARLAGGDKVRERALSMMADLPLWMAAAEEKLRKGGMDAGEAARVAKAIEVIRQAAQGNQQSGVAAVRGALTA